MEVQMSNLEHLQPVIDPLNRLSESLRDHEVKTEKSFDEPVDLDMTYGKYGDHTNDEEEEFKDAEIVPGEHIPVNDEDSNIIQEIPRKSSLTGDHIRRSIRKEKQKNRTLDTPHLVQESEKTRRDNNSFSRSLTEQGSAMDVDVPLDKSYITDFSKVRRPIIELNTAFTEKRTHFRNHNLAYKGLMVRITEWDKKVLVISDLEYS
ncbi:hypothetical protein QAD02_021107 [Eretmocerus hayati]|uniref:Uncharacterized protein n=1 Tax=Eretmocerus hayati TaxID=131215 RepID=A0ACC2PP00_9HYME|nr:hypothetical protein QAD02_021107 [Eretmocerus hayati]